MSDDWKEQKKRQKAIFTAQQNLPYEVKVRRAELRAREFIQELDRRGMNAHVSVGGLDSIVLMMFLRKATMDHVQRWIQNECTSWTRNKQHPEAYY